MGSFTSRYQVNPGVTGELFEPTVDSIRATVREFDPAEYNTENIQDEAHKYRYEKFENQLRSLVLKGKIRIVGFGPTTPHISRM